MKVNWGEVMYPYGCEPIYVHMEEKELLKRLRKISYELRQEETSSDVCQDYKQLALHLADKSFMMHSNKEIQFHIAVCITSILRISSPISPYDDYPEHPEVFLFLINQLKDLNRPQSGSEERFFFILSSLIHVNAFIVCDSLERSEEIFTTLFTSMFQMLETNHTQQFQKLAVVLMESLLEQSEQICQQVLGIVLENYMESNREVVEALLKRLEGTLSPYIEKNFLEILSRKSNEHLMEVVYSIASKLNTIYPKFIEAFLPRLKDSLRSEDIDKRANSISVLSNLLSARESNLGEREPAYLEAFFRKFVDKSERIRALCIRKCKDFLLNQPNLRGEVIKRLKLMQYDKCEDVRLEVVITIIDVAKEELRILIDEPELLSCIEERSFDVSDRIRHEILKESTHLYREQCRNNELSPELQNVLLKILNKILSNYYLQDEGDKYFIERLVNVRLIDFNIETQGRIRNLYDLFVTISTRARSAFIQMQIHQQSVRKLINELLKLTEDGDDENREKMIKILSGFFPEPREAERNLHRFSADLMTNHELLGDMKILMDPHVSCRIFTSKVADVLSKVADPDRTDPYYKTIKILLERSSSVLIDAEAVVCLIDQVVEKLGDGSNEHFNIIAVKGFYLLEVISFVFPSHFSHDRIIERLLRIFDSRNLPNSEITTKVLSIINNIGRYVLNNRSPGTMNLNELRDSLEPICRSLAECGTPKQAKQAIRAICGFLSSKSDEICGELLTIAEESLDPSSQDFQTAIATIGYIATYSSCDRRRIKELIKKLTIEVIVPEFHESIDITGRAWCAKDALPSRATRKLLAMKSVTRCLLSLQKPTGATTRQIFEVFDAFIKYKGDIHRNNEVLQAEMSWLRLQAGSCLLKLCKFEGFDDNMTSAQFYNLSRLMVDDVPEVRERFSGKLEKGLRAKCPGECLAMDFMGFYALGGLETEEKMRGRLRWQMMGIIKKKKAFIENPLVTGNGEGSEVWSNLLPECILVYAVPILAHLPKFSEPENLEQLIMIKKCLEFILQPYVDNSNSEENETVKYYGFFKHLIARMKQCRDSEKPNNDRLQSKLSAVCDVAASVIDGKTSKKVKILAEMETIPFDPNIPKKYLQFDEELDTSHFGLSVDVLENISELDVSERKKMTAAKGAQKRMINRTFGLKSGGGRKRRAENTSVEGTTRKRRRR